MECIPAVEVTEAKLDAFLMESKQLNRETFLKNGFVVIVEKEIIGCFELELISSRQYWLKQLYIIQSEAQKLPVLLEYILLLASERNASVVYAHSEQPVTDLLLESMSFSLQTDQIDLLKQKRSGTWWAYKVS